MLTFSKAPANAGDVKMESNLSPDGRALTITFGDFIASAGNGKAAAGKPMRVFSTTLPLAGGDKYGEIEFTLQGFAATDKRGTGTLLISVNGQSEVADFGANADKSIFQKLKFSAYEPAECRLTVALVAGGDTNSADAGVLMNVTAIDAEILPRPQ